MKRWWWALVSTLFSLYFLLFCAPYEGFLPPRPKVEEEQAYEREEEKEE